MSARDRLAVMLTTSPLPDGEWSNEEIDKAINAFAHELAEEIRDEVPRGYCPCADLIDPEVK
ncbi:hypothetical protein [Streptomyces johnsoniae]|uniref:Uncharacterized protein n=1 Tax=Streptomyces johnsoniae TaxID=3075532 RepID=A0ABU2S076_9ACTN|nr:hypothetical protein [Streptomyces sp. DSM 41886]MDT0442345.1 hypothetical protein [Streptomyces sp. DSM 41886]